MGKWRRCEFCGKGHWGEISVYECGASIAWEIFRRTSGHRHAHRRWGRLPRADQLEIVQMVAPEGYISAADIERIRGLKGV